MMSQISEIYGRNSMYLYESGFSRNKAFRLTKRDRRMILCFFLSVNNKVGRKYVEFFKKCYWFWMVGSKKIEK